MESGHPAQGDILQVIPRRPSGGPPEGGGTGSRRLVWLPARRRKLTRIVIGAVAACSLILVAAGIAHMLRPNQDAAAFAATGAATVLPTIASPAAATTAPPPGAASAPSPAATDAPQSGTLHLLRPAAPGKVWLDGQKITVASTTVACGDHQLKVGRAKAHAITVPCGGDLKVSR